MNVATRPDAATSRGYKTGMLLTAEILIFDPVTRGVEERGGGGWKVRDIPRLR